MPIPKVLQRAVESALRGESPNLEDRAAVKAYLRRGEAERPVRGRPPAPSLARFRGAFAPVYEFESLRAMNVRQEDALAAVTSRYHISSRTFWSRRAYIGEVFGEVLGDFREIIRNIARAEAVPESLSTKDKMFAAIRRAWAGIASEFGADEVIAFAEAMERPGFVEWVGNVSDDAWAAGLADLKALIEMWASDPDALAAISPSDREQIFLTVWEIGYTHHVVTATNALISQQQ